MNSVTASLLTAIGYLAKAKKQQENINPQFPLHNHMLEIVGLYNQALDTYLSLVSDINAHEVGLTREQLAGMVEKLADIE